MFFGLFGSTSKQRQAAREFKSETGGTIRNLYKKDINVQYTTWLSQKDLSSSANLKDPTLLEGIVSSSIRTYFNKETGATNGSDYYDGTMKVWRKYESVSTYKPDMYDNWSESDNFVAKATYSITNSFYVTGQNLFTKHFAGSSTAVTLNGEVTNANENVEAFTSVGTMFIPAAKAVKGVTYLEKLNAAQFSKMFKGTVLARSAPALRGQVKTGLNYIFTKYNGFIPSGKFMFTLTKKLKPKGDTE